MIQVDDLSDIGQCGKCGLEGRVVKSGAAVQEGQGRLGPHHRAVRHQACSLDVKEEAFAIDTNKHASCVDGASASSAGLALRRLRSGAVMCLACWCSYSNGCWP